MRKEVFGIGTYAHIIQRGARGGSLVRDDYDRWRFLKLLRYLNDENVPRNWEREITLEHVRSGYARPLQWPQRKQYVSLMAYCLLDNHFHLLVREEQELGISRFMQRLCTSMAAHFNVKHKEKGSLFQGPYKATVVDDDRYLQYVNAYIHVKNGFERQHIQAQLHASAFDKLFDRATQDPFVGLADYLEIRNSGIIDIERCKEILMDAREFKRFARDVIAGRSFLDANLE